MTLDNTTRGILLCLLAMAIFAWMDVVTKTLSTQLSPVQILWVRYFLAVPVIVAVTAPSGLRQAVRSARPGLQLLRGALLIIEMGFVIVGYRTTTLAEAQSIFALTPLLVTALSVPLLGEKVGWRRWCAVAAGLVGVLVILRPGFAEWRYGMLLMLSSATIYALYQVLTRICGRYDPASTSILWQMIGGTLMLTVIGPFLWQWPTGEQWLYLMVLALLGLSGHYCLVRALTYAPAVIIQPFTYTMLVWAVIVGFLVFHDVPDLWTISGAVLIVASGLYAAWRERVRSKRPIEPAKPLHVAPPTDHLRNKIS